MECNTKLGLRTGLSLMTGEEKDCLQRDYNYNRPVQLDLLPLAPVPLNSMAPASFPPFSRMPSNGNCDGDASRKTRLFGPEETSERAIDVNQMPSAADCDDHDHDHHRDEYAAVDSSPNSTLSTLNVDSASNLCLRKRDTLEADQRACSRASDEEEGGSTRKKLRLSKEQSALLEESFKDHNTLNPKQKLALAKRLNLSHRQVEVWFQNRRARTKLKQTEVDCEFLKRCFDNLTEENRRLKKELYELRALKVASPFYMQMPAPTLTMCPSCERIATTDNGRHLQTLTSDPSTLRLNPTVRS